MVVATIISGGQTGVDRAALDVALELGLPCGGWCPKGRRAEDGVLPSQYPLTETPSEEYVQRTTWNVRDADGTLIVTMGPATGGTAQTIDDAMQLNKPHLIVDLATHPDPVVARAWLSAHRIRTLNVAGPRESKSPGIYVEASQFLRQLLL
ncbi:MAG: putative molybdenum carrier protein [Candidatus Omnitrophica bacterium]|nr:putative molybdenum carrier protein [Candidatus Omnitrophota bacterium]